MIDIKRTSYYTIVDNNRIVGFIILTENSGFRWIVKRYDETAKWGFNSLKEACRFVRNNPNLFSTTLIVD